MFITDVIKRYCSYFEIIFEEDNYEELGNIINPYVNPNKIDFFNGITRTINNETETYYDENTQKNEDVHMYITKYNDAGVSLGIRNIVDSDSEVESSILDVDNAYRTNLYLRASSTLNTMKDALSQYRKGNDNTGHNRLVNTISGLWNTVSDHYLQTLTPELLADSTTLDSDIEALDKNINITNYNELSKLTTDILVDIDTFINTVYEIIAYCRINPNVIDVTLISNITTLLDAIESSTYSITQKELAFNKLLSTVTDLKTEYTDIFTNNSNNNTEKEVYIKEFLDSISDVIETLQYSNVTDSDSIYYATIDGNKKTLSSDVDTSGETTYYYVDSDVSYVDSDDVVYTTLVDGVETKLSYNNDTSTFYYTTETGNVDVETANIVKKVYVTDVESINKFGFGDVILEVVISYLSEIESEFNEVILNDYTTDLDYNESMQKISTYLNDIINGSDTAANSMSSISDAINLIRLESISNIILSTTNNITSVYSYTDTLQKDTIDALDDSDVITTSFITSKITTYASEVNNKLQNTYDLVLQNYDNNVSLLYGTDGSIDGLLPSDNAVSSLLIKGYKGEIDDSLLDKDLYPIDVILDANYTTAVKNAIITLVTDIRGDFIGILDTKLQATPEDAINYRKSSLSVSDYKIAIFAQDFVVEDNDYTLTNIEVTTPYFLASKIPQNDNNNGIQWNFVGPRRGVISGFNEISYVPNPTWKEAMYKAQVNYVERDTTSTRLGSQLTSQNTISALSNLNNVRALLRIQREVEELMRDYIFEWNDDTTISEAQLSLNSYLAQWTTNRACTSISGLVYSSDYDKLEKLLRVKIEMVFNSIIERVAIDLVVNS
jgi:hypothetical protein